MPTAEELARLEIDRLLAMAGWSVQDYRKVDLSAGRGIAVREFELGHPQAVTDGVNVNYDVYRIKTEVTEAGSKVAAGYWLQVLDKSTRARHEWQLDDDFEYTPEELDRNVQTTDQILTIARELRHRWRSASLSSSATTPQTDFQ